MKLIIVESPTKAKTIERFFGKAFTVASSYGHIRDLPKSKLGVDVEHDFEPSYVIPTKARKNVNALKKLAAKAKAIILATDEDREGEAIAWHLTQALEIGKKAALPAQRIVFHEITKPALEEALEHPRDIDMRLVNAQQARRVLDRIVGYLLSPFLWKKVVRGLSAGRVQSVALHLIAEREEEIKKFRPEEYWTILANFRPANGTEREKQFPGILVAINGAPVPKLGIKTKEEAVKIAEEIGASSSAVKEVEKKIMRRNPFPPFTTSTLQQEANRRFRFSAKQTMRIAQNLYENGHITYMRTDSVNLSQESLQAARRYIAGALGKEYLLEGPRIFKTKSKTAQEAHEAIRPTDPFAAPETFGEKLENSAERKLYELIWRRFIASQLPPALFQTVTFDIEATSERRIVYLLRANGISLHFDGFLKIWPHKTDEKLLPDLKAGEDLVIAAVNPEQHFTEPPPRYNEASLIKTLEAHGIGRPSTYAPTISVIQERNYVQKNESRRFEPTEIGTVVNRLLSEHFPEIVDTQFTARMEENLDAIAAGNAEWRNIIREFYLPFSKHLEQKYKEVSKDSFVTEEATDEKCEKCGKPMAIKTGRFGKFLACTGFPECKSTRSIAQPQQSIGQCPKCSKGEVVMKRTRTRRIFYGCNRYPGCDFASWKKPALSGETTEKEQ